MSVFDIVTPCCGAEPLLRHGITEYRCTSCGDSQHNMFLAAPCGCIPPSNMGTNPLAMQSISYPTVDGYSGYTRRSFYIFCKVCGSEWRESGRMESMSPKWAAQEGLQAHV